MRILQRLCDMATAIEWYGVSEKARTIECYGVNEKVTNIE